LIADKSANVLIKTNILKALKNKVRYYGVTMSSLDYTSNFNYITIPL